MEHPGCSLEKSQPDLKARLTTGAAAAAVFFFFLGAGRDSCFVAPFTGTLRSVAKERLFVLRELGVSIPRALEGALRAVLGAPIVPVRFCCTGGDPWELGELAILDGLDVIE